MILAQVQDLTGINDAPVVVVLDDSSVFNPTKARQLATTIRSTVRGAIVDDPQRTRGHGRGHSMLVRTTDVEAVVTAIEALI